jgi:hypothetical protein
MIGGARETLVLHWLLTCNGCSTSNLQRLFAAIYLSIHNIAPSNNISLQLCAPVSEYEL